MRASVVLRRAGLAAMRLVIVCVIVVAGLAVMKYMGLPVPGPSELLDKFKGVSRLADILS